MSDNFDDMMFSDDFDFDDVELISTSSTKAKRHASPPGTVVDGKYVGETSVVRDIPLMLMQRIRAEFPEAKNNTDALMAFIVCHGEGSVVDVGKLALTPSQSSLVRGWGGNGYRDVTNKIEMVMQKAESIIQSTESLELLTTYLILDRLGFCGASPDVPQNTDFHTNGLVELAKVARESTPDFQRALKMKLGAPRRR